MTGASPPSVGFIGLGNQGAPMARRIVDEGFSLTIWARRPESLAPFADTNATVAESPADVGRRSDIVAVCVVADADVEDVVLRDDGVLAGMDAGSVLVIHSTVRPETCHQLADVAAAHGVTVVDAPVSGGGEQAARRELAVMVGGADADVARCRPVFETFAGTVLHLGGVGTAQMAKVVNNLTFIAQLSLAVETFAFARDLGVDRDALAQVLASGSGGSQAAAILAAMEFDLSGPQGALEVLRKDVGLAGQLADAAGIEVPEHLAAQARWTLELLATDADAGTDAA